VSCPPAFSLEPEAFSLDLAMAKAAAAAFSPYPCRSLRALLADMPAAVFALEPGAELADEAVARGPALNVSAAIAVM